MCALSLNITLAFSASVYCITRMKNQRRRPSHSPDSVCQHQGPYTGASISSKGVATIVKGSTCQRHLQLNARFRNIAYLFVIPVFINCHILVYYQINQLRGCFSKTTVSPHFIGGESIHIHLLQSKANFASLEKTSRAWV